MTFETTTVLCPACGKGKLQAEADKGGTLFLWCLHEKCGARIPAEAVMLIRAEKDTKRVPGVQSFEAAASAMSKLP